MFGVDAEAHVDFHGLVEIGELDFLEKRYGLLELVFLRFHLLQSSLIFFTWFSSHNSSLVQPVRKKRRPPTERFQGTFQIVAERARGCNLPRFSAPIQKSSS